MVTSCHKTLVLTLATLLSMAASFAAADSKTYQNALKSTAWVLAKDNGETSSGTGVLVDAEKRLVVTNYHVVGTARNAVVFFPDMDGSTPKVDRAHYLKNVKTLGLKGRIVAADLKRDLALIELPKLPAGVEAISMAKETTSPGEEVHSIGNPGATDALWVYTSGTVRSVYQKQFRTGAGDHDFKVVETQSPINSGDSGGPVVNASGELVAISQAISPKARLVSYCVDITEIRAFMDEPWKPAPLSISDTMELADLETKKTETGDFSVEVSIGEGDDAAKQTVTISNDLEYYERIDMRKLWSVAAVLSEAPSQDAMLNMLNQSAKTKLGAWSVEKTADEQYLIVYVVKIDATATPAAFKSAIEYTARLAHKSRDEFKTSETKAEDAASILSQWLAE